MNSVLKVFWVSVIALMAVAFVAACGNGGDDGGSSGGGSAPSATSTPRPSATATPVPVSSDEAPDPDSASGEITVAVFEVPPGVGLGSAQAPVEVMQYWGVGEGLFASDAEGNIVNKLATGFSVAPDLSFVEITLRDDVVFHKDWGPFSADDVVWTLNDSNAATNPNSIHGQAGDFAAVFTEASKIDDNTVRIGFNTFDLRWDGNFLNEQAQGTAFFSKRAYDEMGEDWLRENIVSTGPI